MSETDFKRCLLGVPPQLSGFVCAFHPPAPGSTPKHAIYAFIIYSQISAIFVLHCEKNENKQKEARFGPLKRCLLARVK